MKIIRERFPLMDKAWFKGQRELRDAGVEWFTHSWEKPLTGGVVWATRDKVHLIINKDWTVDWHWGPALRDLEARVSEFAEKYKLLWLKVESLRNLNWEMIWYEMLLPDTIENKQEFVEHIQNSGHNLYFLLYSIFQGLNVEASWSIFTVNIAPNELINHKEQLISYLKLMSWKLKGRELVFELTEQKCENPSRLIEAIKSLKGLWIRFALDDILSGSNSPELALELAEAGLLSYAKIDWPYFRKVVSEWRGSQNWQALKTLIYQLKSKRCRIIIEFVWNDKLRQEASDLWADVVQWYLYKKKDDVLTRALEENNVRRLAKKPKPRKQGLPETGDFKAAA